MSMKDWLVVGIGGGTNCGKTTIATHLKELLPNAILIKQDDYFLDVSDLRQTHIEEINHINFEILSSLDMERMWLDIQQIISTKSRKNETDEVQKRILLFDNAKELEELISEVQYIPNILIIEGFLIFNDKKLRNLCDLRIMLTLDKETMWARRQVRVYEPPDPPGYFDICVWPYYLQHYNAVLRSGGEDLYCIDAADSLRKNISSAVTSVLMMLLLKPITSYL